MHFDESDQLFVTYVGNARKCIQSRKLIQAASHEQMNETEGVSEQLKDENQMEWVCRMQNIEARAREIVSTELIYT